MVHLPFNSIIHGDCIEILKSLPWLRACQRFLKGTGTIWNLGTYHNIFRVAQKCIDAVTPFPSETLTLPEKRRQARVPFGVLLENGLLNPGEILYFSDNGEQAKILSNGHIKCGEVTGSIHGVAKSLINGAPVNGWDAWFYKDAKGNKIVIDELRIKFKNH